MSTLYPLPRIMIVLLVLLGISMLSLSGAFYVNEKLQRAGLIALSVGLLALGFVVNILVAKGA